MDKNSRVSMKKTKKSRKKRTILVTILTLFLIVGGYAGYLVYETVRAANDAYTEIDRGNKSKLRETEITMGKDPFSVLLMGIEDYSTGGTNGRTDTLMLATFNPDTQTMKLLSIPRDTRVFFPDRNYYSKINHAHAYGGKEMTIDRIEELLGVPVDYFATVNFDGFKNIIDIVGGVTVDVPFSFSERSDTRPRYDIHFTEGEMTLGGEEALAYARMRKKDPRGDFGRNDRQKQIVEATINELTSPQNLLRIDRIARELGQNIETNVRITDAIGLTSVYSNFNTSKIEQLSIKGTDDYINNIYYFIPDEIALQEVQTELKVHLGILPESALTIDEEGTEGTPETTIPPAQPGTP
ncbi:MULTISPECIES: LCP family protein [Sutcliffiella]|uniref:LytR family transcriptional regulator n=1 Tax=Sutcliffiella cohnii TaxID=33932 RepID=A0A223KVG4_9BACI|nr:MULTISPECIES: LCP family protein [Sutcliffiella]AST93354.1 LytR family transcriptional regulator [Sutcliffiella cohnii]MED4019006.1 LCP family protein [Sutcliffiella cohnii]WBL14515.1 LCP family protein [Sutcliffiella sp. NC1]